MAAKPEAVFNGLGIEEGWRAKQRQWLLRLFWGADFVQFLAAQAVLPRSIWKKGMNSSFSSIKFSFFKSNCTK